jgi:hypothetical protein
MKTQYALWAFAKAPLILSGDLTKMGSVNETESLGNMFNNSNIRNISQDILGNQCEEFENLNGTGQNDSLSYYKSMNENAETKEKYFALLIVNWSDDNLLAPTKVDLVKAGLALSPYSHCDFTDLWNGKVTTEKAGKHVFDTANLAKHSH